MSYRKIGGLHWLTLGKLKLCWCWSSRKSLQAKEARERAKLRKLWQERVERSYADLDQARLSRLDGCDKSAS